MVREWMVASIALAVLAVGCGGTVESAAPTATPSATASPSATSTRTPRPTATPSATATPVASPSPGANITYFGLATADDLPLQPTSIDSLGRPIYERRFGQGFSIVIEGRPGSDRAPVGHSAFNYDPADATARPDLQMLLSRPLGNGSSVVCDNSTPTFGGIPAVNPPNFSETQVISDAINDLGCRFQDGSGRPIGRGPQEACTRFEDGDFRFVDGNSTVQFCAGIAASFRFPQGDTILTAQLRDTDGVTGPVRQIVVRITLTPSGSPTTTRTPLPTNSPTPTATRTAPVGLGASITFFGLVGADDFLLQPTDFDPQGRPIYYSRLGRAFSIVVEGQPGSNRSPVGHSSFNYDPADPTVRPDLQVLVSQPLGNGSSIVCDNSMPNIGGIPAVDPPDFSETQPISDAINDLGCRFVDGSGLPLGRGELEACTVFEDGQYHFINPASTLQFCARIATAFGFPVGDTVVTARLRDLDEMIGETRQLVVRVPPR